MNKIKQYIEEREEDFKSNFTWWEIMGSTLNDGSKERWNRTPKEGREHNSQTIKGLIDMIVEGIEDIERGGEQDEIHDEVRERTLLEIAELLKTINK